jgi:hypothetical protein
MSTWPKRARVAATIAWMSALGADVAAHGHRPVAAVGVDPGGHLLGQRQLQVGDHDAARAVGRKAFQPARRQCRWRRR